MADKNLKVGLKIEAGVSQLDEIDELIAKLKENGDEVSDLESVSERLRAEWDKLPADELKKKYDDLNNVVRATASAEGLLSKSTNKTTNATKEQLAELDALIEKLKESGVDVSKLVSESDLLKSQWDYLSPKQLSKEFQKLANKVRETNEDFEKNNKLSKKVGRTFSALRKTVLGVGAVFTAVSALASAAFAGIGVGLAKTAADVTNKFTGMSLAAYKYRNAVQGIQDAWTKAKSQIGGAILTPLTNGIKNLTEKLNELIDKGLFKRIGELAAKYFEMGAEKVTDFFNSIKVDDIVNKIDDFAQKTSTFVSGVTKTFSAFNLVFQALRSGVNAIGLVFGTVFLGIDKAVEATQKRLLGFAQSIGADGWADNLKSQLKATRDEIDALEASNAKMAASITDAREQMGSSYDKLAKSVKTLGTTTDTTTQKIKSSTEALNSNANAADNLAAEYQKISDSLNAIGVDYQEVTTGISSSFSTLLEKSDAVFSSLKANGRDSAEVINASFASIAASIKTPQELDALIVKFNDVGETAKLTADTIKNAFSNLGENINSADALQPFLDSLKKAKDAGIITAQQLQDKFGKVFNNLLRNSNTLEDLQRLEDIMTLSGNSAFGTAQQMMTLKEKITDVQSAAIGSSGAIDDNTKSLDKNTQAAKKNADAQEDLAQSTDDMQKLSDNGYERLSKHMDSFKHKTEDSTSAVNTLNDSNTDALKDSVKATRDEMDSLTNSAKDTTAQLKQQLAELQGNTLESQRLRQEQKLAKLQEKMRAAQSKNNLDAVRQYQEAIRLQRQIGGIQQQKASAKAQQATAPNTVSQANTLQGNSGAQFANQFVKAFQGYTKAQMEQAKKEAAVKAKKELEQEMLSAAKRNRV